MLLTYFSFNDLEVAQVLPDCNNSLKYVNSSRLLYGIIRNLDTVFHVF